jgi:hypothetical protein
MLRSIKGVKPCTLELYFLKGVKIIMESFFLVMMGIGGGIVYYNYIRYKGYLKTAALCLDSPQILGFFSPRLIGKFSGCSVKITTRPGGRSSPPIITMCLYTPTPFDLTIYREGTMQKIGKKMGVISEIQIGVPDFDDRYIIQTNSYLHAETFLSDRTIRDTIDFFFTSGYANFQIVDGALRLTRISNDMGYDLQHPTVQAILQKMVDLAHNL